MMIFDFVTQEEMDALPDDDTQAFTTFVSLAQPRLSEMTRNADFDLRADREWIEEARYSFVNIVTLPRSDMRSSHSLRPSSQPSSTSMKMPIGSSKQISITI